MRFAAVSFFFQQVLHDLETQRLIGDQAPGPPILFFQRVEAFRLAPTVRRASSTDAAYAPSRRTGALSLLNCLDDLFFGNRLFRI